METSNVKTQNAKTQSAENGKSSGFNLPKLPSLPGKKKEEPDPQYIQEVPKEKSFKDRVKEYLPW